MMKLFDLVMNASRCSQGVKLKGGEIVTLERGTIIDEHVLRSTIPSHFIRIDNILDELGKRDEKRFFVYRTFSLGDVLMLVPAIRYLREKGYDAYMKTIGEYTDIVRRLDVPVVESFYNTQNDLGIIFDYVIEQDHSNSKLCRYHRTHLYLSAMGIEDLPEYVDWSSKLENFIDVPFDLPEYYVVFQAQGSNIVKQLPAETILKIAKRLNDQGIFVYFIGKPSDLDFQNKLTVNLGLRSLKCAQLFTLIAHARMLLCVDSSPLWISHFTQTPVACILGPTNFKQRLTLHPFYPDGTIPIQLNELMNCDSCFEMKQRCDGKVSCFNQDSEKVADFVIHKIANFLEGS